MQVNVALNSVAAERPADFRAALCTTLRKPDILSTAISSRFHQDKIPFPVNEAHLGAQHHHFCSQAQDSDVASFFRVGDQG
jgi:hypothetical protein